MSKFQCHNMSSINEGHTASCICSYILCILCFTVQRNLVYTILNDTLLSEVTYCDVLESRLPSPIVVSHKACNNMILNKEWPNTWCGMPLALDSIISCNIIHIAALRMLIFNALGFTTVKDRCYYVQNSYVSCIPWWSGTNCNYKLRVLQGNKSTSYCFITKNQTLYKPHWYQ